MPSTIDDPTRTGVTFASFQALGMDVGLSMARRSAELGFGSIWTAETVGPEAFSTLAAMSAVAPTLDLGTGVLALQLRTPMLTAMGAATLQSLAPDRNILLGVGISSPVVVGRWHGATYGDHPIAQVREFLDLTSQCLGGDAVSFEGDHYHCSKFRLGVRLGDRRPKLVLGALNPRMLQLAGETADGVLLNYLPATAVPWCVEQVRAGERAGGRDPGRCTVYAYVHVGVCDPEAARVPARRDLFSYGVVPAYARAFERAGFGDEMAALRSARASGDREASVAAISDRMVDAIDICGDAATVSSAVQQYRAAGVDIPVIMPLPWGEDRVGTIEATLAAVAPELTHLDWYGRSMELRDKVVVVTGGGSGIGAALCRRFAHESPTALVVADIDERNAGSVAAEIRSLAPGTEVDAVGVDVAVESAVRGLVDATIDRFGHIDLFVGNAGIGTGAGLDATDTQWQAIWEVNLMAHVYAARALLPGWQDRGEGYLLITASAAGLLTNLGDAPYSVTKHAAVALAEWIAITHGDSGVKVSCLCPQGVRTPLLFGSIGEGELSTEVVKAQGVIEPEEVAEVVVRDLGTETFLILPHPEVEQFEQRRAGDRDRWLASMRKLQARTVGD